MLKWIEDKFGIWIVFVWALLIVFVIFLVIFLGLLQISLAFATGIDYIITSLIVGT